MKKIIALASAALIFSACDDSTSATGGVNLGTKFLSAQKVTVDEANQTIDMSLPICEYVNGKAVLETIASGPSPYTITDGRLIIDDSAFPAKGTNKSIIGVWDMDPDEMMGDEDMDFQQIGFKMYLDIGKNNFDIYVNSDNVCMAKMFADIMADDPDAEDMNIISQECNKIVIGAEGQKMTIETNPTFPNISMKMSIAGITCEMNIIIEQASEQNCTTENVKNGNFATNGMFFQSQETSKGCALFGMEKATRLAKKVMTKRR